MIRINVISYQDPDIHDITGDVLRFSVAGEFVNITRGKKGLLKAKFLKAGEFSETFFNVLVFFLVTLLY